MSASVRPQRAALMVVWLCAAMGMGIGPVCQAWAQSEAPTSRAAKSRSSTAADAVPVIFDTDIMGDVDDVGAVAVLHALANRGEATILAMAISSKHPACGPCLDAMNTYFGRPDIPIGVNKGEGFLRDTRYADKIAAEFPHDLRSAEEAPDATVVYRQTLAAQPDGSVVIVSVGQVSNLASLLASPADELCPLDGRALVGKKVKAWVCMGGRFPNGREANLVHHGPAAKQAISQWPTPIIFSGFEIGVKILTGGGLKSLPKTSPVRRAYQLFNGIKPHKSWDQTAVLYGVRCLNSQGGTLWRLQRTGYCHVFDNGENEWRLAPDKDHFYLLEALPPAQVAGIIEQLMLELPVSKSAVPANRSSQACGHCGGSL